MYTISTSAFVSILALVSLLAVFIQADGPRKVCAQYHDVVKGETCNSLNSVYHLAKGQIHSMNHMITCADEGDSALPGGEILCVGVNTPACTKWDFADDTKCGGLPFRYKISRTLFVEYNDNVDDNCNNVVKGQNYCVSIK